MSLSWVKSREQRLIPRPMKRASSQEHTLRWRTEIPEVLDSMAAALWTKFFSAKEINAVRLAVEEALVNAVVHGHRGDSRKLVRVWYVYLPKSACLVVTIRDEGDGFEPATVPDPRQPEYLDRPDGRGLLLMKASMNWVRFSECGKCVTMCKRRSQVC